MRQTSAEIGQDLEREIEEVKRKLENAPRRLAFLLLGRTGWGKSSTINSLFGREVAPVGAFEATTLRVKEYDHDINGIEVKVWDTPGLCDDLEEVGKNQDYLHEMRSRITRIDSVWFVSRLDETRVSSDEKRCIKVISETLDKRIWEWAVIVLTFADKVDSAEFLQAVQKRSELIRQEISKYAGKQVAQKIPTVPVNNKSERTPDGELWLNELFTKVFTRLPNDGVAPFLLAMEDSIVSPSGTSGPTTAVTGPRIVLNQRQSEEVQQKIRSAGLVGGSALVGTFIGGGAGAVTGLIVAGPPGAAVGARIGIVIGSVAGAVAGWIISLFRQEK